MIPVHSWYNRERGDNFLTTDPVWNESGRFARSGYYRYRFEGLMFSPREPQPAGTVPVFSWWNAERGDNFSTTDPRWSMPVDDIVWNGEHIANGPTQSGYTLYRLEGYVYAASREQPSNSVPIFNWWNPEVGDNFTTTDPRWSDDLAALDLTDNQTVSNGISQHGYTLYRLEGYLIAPTAGTQRIRFNVSDLTVHDRTERKGGGDDPWLISIFFHSRFGVANSTIVTSSGIVDVGENIGSGGSVAIARNEGLGVAQDIVVSTPTGVGAYGIGGYIIVAVEEDNFGEGQVRSRLQSKMADLRSSLIDCVESMTYSDLSELRDSLNFDELQACLLNGLGTEEQENAWWRVFLPRAGHDFMGQKGLVFATGPFVSAFYSEDESGDFLIRHLEAGSHELSYTNQGGEWTVSVSVSLS